MASAKQLFEPKRMLLDRGERTLIRHMRDPKEGMYTVILEYSIGAGPSIEDLRACLAEGIAVTVKRKGVR